MEGEVFDDRGWMSRSCCPFTGQSPQHTGLWRGKRGLRGPPAQREEPLHGWRENNPGCEVVCCCQLDTRRDLISLCWVARGREYDVETPDDPMSPAASQDVFFTHLCPEVFICNDQQKTWNGDSFFHKDVCSLKGRKMWIAAHESLHLCAQKKKYLRAAPYVVLIQQSPTDGPK